LRVELDALEIALQDDVDGPGDRVGAVDRSAADGDRLDPVDQLGVDRVQIDLGARGGGSEDAGRVRADEAAAVDESQGALAAQAEEVDEGLTRAEAAGLTADRRRAGHAERRLLIDRLAQGLEAARLDLLRVDHDGRLQGLEIGTRDARAGDDDIAFGGRVGLGRRAAGRFGFLARGHGRAGRRRILRGILLRISGGSRRGGKRHEKCGAQGAGAQQAEFIHVIIPLGKPPRTTEA
jgi:hypothetical protein